MMCCEVHDACSTQQEHSRLSVLMYNIDPYMQTYNISFTVANKSKQVAIQSSWPSISMSPKGVSPASLYQRARSDGVE